MPANATLACINTDYFQPFGECSVPAYLFGFSVYVLSFVGALVFGFVRFWLYSVIEHSWLKLRTRPELLWLPYTLFLVEFRLMLVIPGTIAFAVFVSLLVLSLLTFKRFSAVVFWPRQGAHHLAMHRIFQD